METQGKDVRQLLAFALAATLLLPAPGAYAFKVGIHQSIAESVLKSKGFSDKSLKAAADADYYVDIYEPTSSSAHFDDENFTGGSSRINGKVSSIIGSLAACKKENAMKEMGRALHTVQDFYAHSNWVNHWGGTNPNIYSLSNPPASLACAPPTFAPGGVTSGYFSLPGYLYPSPFITQCASTPANKCCHKDLNKDEGSRPFFGAAQSTASDATREFEERLESMIHAQYPGAKGDSMVKLLKKDQRDIAFVIDDTGSMGNDIAGVKASLSTLATQIAAGDEAPRFSLITFKDTVTFRGTTCDIAELQAKVAGLYASGGGDCPEVSNSAMLTAAGMLDNGGKIFMATDASARDPEVSPTLLSVTQSKNINISVILTGNCVSDYAAPGTVSALSARAEPESIIPPGDLTSMSSVRMFGALTALSGGMLFPVTRAEFPQAANILLIRTRPENADLLYAIDNSDTSGRVFDVPVDSTLTDVTFAVNRLSPSGSFTLTVTRPDGRTVVAGDADASFTNISGVSAVTLTAPAVGHWTAAVGGIGRFVASAFGKSSLNLSRLRFLAPAPLQPPEVDLVPISGMPIAGEAVTAEADMTSGYSSVQFSLRNPDSTVLQPLSLTLDDADRFLGSATAPGTEFLAYATGTDLSGNAFQRVFRKILKGQSLRITPQAFSASGTPGATVTYQFDIANLTPSSGTFRLYTASTNGFPVYAPLYATIAAGATTTVPVSVMIPPTVTDTDDDLLSLVAISTSDPGVSNSAVVTTFVSLANQPPDVSQAAPSLALLSPPNGKFVDVTVTGVTDPDGDAVSIRVDSISQDEPTSDVGSGNTCPDAMGVGTPVASLRSERSGTGDGRIYTVHFTATDGKGGSTSGSVTVCATHDDGKGQPQCVDSGQLYDSTQCF